MKIKRKIKKYNKSFSYANMERKNCNFRYKDFGYSNSYNTRFTGSFFYGNNFFKAKMKYCGFNGCRFQFIEFDNTNFRGCTFKGAIFENVWFNNCIVEKADFRGAIFVNVFYTNMNLLKSKGIQQTDSLVRINQKTAKFQFSQQLLDTVFLCKNNKYILKSNTLFYQPKHRLSSAQKRDLKQLPKADRKEYQRQLQLHNKKRCDLQIHYVNLKRLLSVYSEEIVVAGLHLAVDTIDKDFSSLSYFVPYFERVSKEV